MLMAKAETIKTMRGELTSTNEWILMNNKFRIMSDFVLIYPHVPVKHIKWSTLTDLISFAIPSSGVYDSNYARTCCHVALHMLITCVLCVVCGVWRVGHDATSSNMTLHTRRKVKLFSQQNNVFSENIPKVRVIVNLICTIKTASLEAKHKHFENIYTTIDESSLLHVI